MPLPAAIPALNAGPVEQDAEFLCRLFRIVGINRMVAKADRLLFLCGHVHDAFKARWDKGPILNINIGTDVWNYRPVSEAELDAYIGKVLAGKE